MSRKTNNIAHKTAKKPVNRINEKEADFREQVSSLTVAHYLPNLKAGMNASR
jgi:hypothetical protein